MPVCDRTAATITATSTAMPATSHGKILALAVRPNPNAARSDWTYIAPMTAGRPSRGPSYRWYPMSWMTLASDIGCLPGCEEVRDAVAPLVQAVQGQVEVGHGPQDPVVRGLVGEIDEEQPAVLPDREPLLRQFGEQFLDALAHLDREHVGDLRHVGDPVGPQQPAALDGDQRVADALDLAQQVRTDHHGDAELGADPVHQRQHGVPAGRVEAV